MRSRVTSYKQIMHILKTRLKEGKFYKIKFGVENCDYESFLECIIKHCAPKLNITLEEDGF